MSWFCIIFKKKIEKRLFLDIFDKTKFGKILNYSEMTEFGGNSLIV